MSDKRTREFQRNHLLERLLGQLNDDLQASEKRLFESHQNSEMQYPLILVMGPLRSGTTLFMQWLANGGLVAYPTNLMSRFYRAPIIGAKIQLLLTDPRFNFRDELGEFSQKSEYVSENGKTHGALAPNEFWYFWRSFLGYPQRDVWTDDELERSMDILRLRSELTGIMSVFQKPFAAKGMLFNYNIPFLDRVLEKVLFVQIKRDEVSNVVSVIEARKRQLGSAEKWYSFMIPEYDQLRDLDALSQAAGQVHYINNAVGRGLAEVDESRKLLVQYEKFCEDPKGVFEELVRKLSIRDVTYNGPESFVASQTDDLPNRDEIERQLRYFSGR